MIAPELIDPELGASAIAIWRILGQRPYTSGDLNYALNRHDDCDVGDDNSMDPLMRKF